MSNNNNSQIDRDRLRERGVDEFIGICKGVLFDGIIAEEEASNLLVWLDNNPLVAERWPASDVFNLLLRAIDEGYTEEIEAALLVLLDKLTGDRSVFLEEGNASSNLPLCDPAPSVFFEGALFALTGNMEMGPRKDMVALLESLGAEVVKKDLRKAVDFLVIGNIGSTAWMHSSYGRKIERAIDLRDVKQTGIGIISEAHLLSFVDIK